ncbi:MAG: hypothetical protein ACYTFV_14350 [Planctomycetota bacterium]|jgi:hypothetical protein
MKTATQAALPALIIGAALPTFAQDSVSLVQGLPGDAVSPYDAASAANGSEQKNRYVVDMATFDSSWGNEFLIAPISKSSRTSSLFLTSLFSSQSISRTQAKTTTTGNTYSSWNGVGFGINNDPSISSPGTPVGFPTIYGNRFAAGFQEFGTTDQGEGYDGLVSNVVHYDPSNPGRLYVERTVAAINGSDDFSNVSTIGFGSILNDGTVAFRADSFGASGSSTAGNAPVTGNNIYLTSPLLRDESSLNVISGNQLANYDTAANKFVIQSSSTTWNVPSIANIGGNSSFMGTNFNGEFASGPDFGFAIPVTTHLGTSPDQRGNLSRLEKNFAPLGSTDGLAALLGYSGTANNLCVFGIFDAGAGIGLPTATYNLFLPPVVTDNSTGFTNISGALTNDFSHYQSQVAFQGGNGQVGMNIDRSGNLIVAATADQGDFADQSACPDNYIAVARVSADGSTTEWTMAAYNDGLGGGKPVLDGPGGTAIGQIIPISTIIGVPNAGLSSPMVDSVGNIYFWGAFERFSTGTTATGLIRAIYDEATFSYELELLFTLGEVFPGINSGVDYQIRFVSLVDSNSISSSAPFSGNISEEGYAGQTYPWASIDDPLHLGGLILAGEIVYDVDGNGTFDDASANPGSPDEDYQTLLYITGTTAAQPDLGFQGPGESHLTVTGSGLGGAESSVATLTGAAPNSVTFAVLAAAGAPNLPFGAGTIVGGTAILSGFPLQLAIPANGVLQVPISGTPVAIDFSLQFATVNLAFPGFVEFSNAVMLQFGK